MSVDGHDRGRWLRLSGAVLGGYLMAEVVLGASRPLAMVGAVISLLPFAWTAWRAVVGDEVRMSAWHRRAFVGAGIVGAATAISFWPFVAVGIPMAIERSLASAGPLASDFRPSSWRHGLIVAGACVAAGLLWSLAWVVFETDASWTAKVASALGLGSLAPVVTTPLLMRKRSPEVQSMVARACALPLLGATLLDLLSPAHLFAPYAGAGAALIVAGLPPRSRQRRQYDRSTGVIVVALAGTLVASWLQGVGLSTDDASALRLLKGILPFLGPLIILGVVIGRAEDRRRRDARRQAAVVPLLGVTALNIAVGSEVSAIASLLAAIGLWWAHPASAER